MLKPKLRTYRLLKTSCNAEIYLKSFMSKYKRSLLVQIRTGILPLNIETGRHRNIPVDLRLCTLCDLNETESEEHFICRCRVYEDLRKKLYLYLSVNYPNFNNRNDQNKLVLILGDECKYFSSHFLEGAWKRRKMLLYKNNV